MTVAEAHLGVFRLTLMPTARCAFQANPAHALRAALLRRLELFDPELTSAMHAEDEGAATTVRPWSLSSLVGPPVREDGSVVVEPGRTYSVFVGCLAPRVIAALEEAFRSNHPLAGEPLELQGIPFYTVRDECRWNRLTTYTSLLGRARPGLRIALQFRSPTAFRVARHYSYDLAPALCVGSWLRRWNAFSPVVLPSDEVAEYAHLRVRVIAEGLKATVVKLGGFGIPGAYGVVTWRVDDGPVYPARLVNALVDFAQFCGTGVQTTQGMGQTRRLRAMA